jgi:hypothetical protein
VPTPLILAGVRTDKTKAGEKAAFDLEQEAIQNICRALANLMAHTGIAPMQGPRFAGWMRRNRPDLMADDDIAGSADL